MLAALAARWQEGGLESASERELLVPCSMEAGSPEQLRFLTFGRTISPLWDEVTLWERMATLWQGEATRWLFEAEAPARADWRAIEGALKTAGLGAKRQEVMSWLSVAKGLFGRFKGDVRGLIEAGNGEAGTILAYLDQNPTTFPILSGATVAPIWLDQLARVGGVAVAGTAALRVPPSERAAAALADIPDAPPLLHPEQAVLLEVWAALGARARKKVVAEIED